MKNINKVLSIILVLSIALSMGCVGEITPQYKTIEHSEPIYEYTQIISYQEVYTQDEQHIPAIPIADEYSEGYWNFLKEFYSCNSSNINAANYHSDCLCESSGIVSGDKLVFKITSRYYEGDNLREVTMIYTATREKEITGYNTWTEEVRVN